MCFLPQFEYDLFISYSHIDDEPADGSEDGWVTVFHRRLEKRANQLLGHKIEIYRDTRLGRDEKYNKTLLDYARRSALFAAILTPGFINSRWCPKELKTFTDEASQNGGLYVNDVSRLYKVVKTKYPLEATRAAPLDALNEMLGFKFYRLDEQSDRSREFPLKSKEYWEILDDLAHRISASLQRMRNNPPGSPPASGELDRKKVFVGFTTKDLEKDREALVRSLEGKGFQVLPQRPITHLDTAREIERRLREELVPCRLAVLLFGASYGLVPDSQGGPRRSLGKIQYDIVTSSALDLKRLIWIPENLEPLGDDQKRLIDQIKADVNKINRLEWTGASLEDLKTQALDELRPKVEANGQENPAKNDRHRVYLIYDESDADNKDIEIIAKSLFKFGLDVHIPLFKKDAEAEEELLLDHEENLRWCESVLICHGNGSEAWRRAKVRDLAKASGLGRTTPLRVKAIYLGPIETHAKRMAQMTYELDVFLENYEKFTPEDLSPFFDRVLSE